MHEAVELRGLVGAPGATDRDVGGDGGIEAALRHALAQRRAGVAPLGGIGLTLFGRDGEQVAEGLERGEAHAQVAQQAGGGGIVRLAGALRFLGLEAGADDGVELPELVEVAVDAGGHEAALQALE